VPTIIKQAMADTELHTFKTYIFTSNSFSKIIASITYSNDMTSLVKKDSLPGLVSP